MHYLLKRVAYLKGLASGFGPKSEAQRDKLLAEMLQVMEEMADTIADLDVQLNELDAYVDAVDGDLNEVELHLYGETSEVTDAEEPGTRKSYIEIVCPYCGETAVFNHRGFLADNDLLCPHCGKRIKDMLDPSDDHDR